jgi:putative transposase
MRAEAACAAARRSARRSLTRPRSSGRATCSSATSASVPNEMMWDADVTYVRTWHGFVCLAFILDCFSRMIVGWQLATHLRNSSLTSSRSQLGRLPRRRARQRDGAETWVATFKSELVDGRRFPSFEHAEHETLACISFYDSERLHEELGDLPPAEYEQLNYKRDNAPTLSAT